MPSECKVREGNCVLVGLLISAVHDRNKPLIESVSRQLRERGFSPYEMLDLIAQTEALVGRPSYLGVREIIRESHRSGDSSAPIEERIMMAMPAARS